jgi:hypothetical protein
MLAQQWALKIRAQDASVGGSDVPVVELREFHQDRGIAVCCEDVANCLSFGRHVVVLDGDDVEVPPGEVERFQDLEFRSFRIDR